MHIASLDYYIDEIYATTEGNKYDNKIDDPQTKLSILNFLEESWDRKNLEKEDNMIQKQATKDTRLSNLSCSSTLLICPPLEQNK